MEDTNQTFSELSKEWLTIHSLRHRHTSLLAEAGVSLEQIIDRLGHSDDHITKNFYIPVPKTIKAYLSFFPTAPCPCQCES